MSRKLTSRVLQQRYGVVDRTIDRWVEAGILPVPMRINKIRYWDEAEIEQLERERMAKAIGEAAYMTEQENRSGILGPAELPTSKPATPTLGFDKPETSIPLEDIRRLVEYLDDEAKDLQTSDAARK